MVAGKSPEWLPLGFTEKIKVKDGRKIKVYTDTSTGIKFYSRPSVIRYLSNTAMEQIKLEVEDERSLKSEISTQSMPITSSGCNSENKNKGNHSFKMVASESESADGIPLGWIIENRTSKSGNKTRKDRYYIDPNSGYIFSSKKDVLRYLETQDIIKCATRPKRMECVDLQLIKNEIHSSSPDNKLSEHIETEQLLAPGESDSGGETSSAKSPESPDAKISEPTQDNRTSSLEDNESHENPNKDAEMNISKEPTEDVKVTIQALAKTDRSLEAPDAKISEPLRDNSAYGLEDDESRETSNKDDVITEPTEDVKLTDQELAKTDSETSQKLPSSGIEKQADEAPAKLRMSKKRKGLILPSRTSKRLAGREAEIQSNLDPKKRELRVAAKRSPSSDVKTLPSCSPETAPDIPLYSDVSPLEEVTTLQIVVHEAPKEIERLKNVEEPIVENEAICDEKQADDSTRSLELQLCFEFGNSNSWPDPCLEFAIKTLTEEIPYEETTRFFRDQFSVPYDQSNEFSKPSDSDVPSVLESEILPHSEPLKQNGALDLLPAKNLNLPTCSGVSSQQSSSEMRNKDCPKLPASGTEKQTNKAPVSSRKSNKREDLSLPSQTSKNFAWNDIATFEFVGEKTLQQFEPPNKVKKPLVENQAIPDDEHKLKDSETSGESQLCYEFGSCWSDPCLEFAFKTLTGEIPVEDTFALSGRFGNQFGVPNNQAKDPTRPSVSDFPTIFQNEIPPHLET